MATARGENAFNALCRLLCVDVQSPPLASLQGNFLAVTLRMLSSGPRASIQMQPIHLTLHQCTLAFLHRFFALAAAGPSPEASSGPRQAMMPAASEGTRRSDLVDRSAVRQSSAHKFFKKVELHNLDLRFDYIPSDRSAAYRALQSTASGDVQNAATEIAQLVPLHDVAFSFSRVRVSTFHRNSLSAEYLVRFCMRSDRSLLHYRRCSVRAHGELYWLR